MIRHRGYAAESPGHPRRTREFSDTIPAMRQNYATKLVLLLLLATSFAAGEKKKSAAIFTDVTERGRALYEYDQAAWHGTDAVLAMQPPKDWRPRYIARKKETGWQVI